jgi:Tfp pilus assembly protein PilX
MQNYQKGQILLIVVLIMVTTLTIGLSVAVRSITNIKTSQDATSSEKAFSAAEAGIEKSLTNNASSSGSFVNNSNYQATIVTVAGMNFALNEGSPILKDDSSDIWLSNYPSYTNQWSGTFRIYAIEVIVLSGSSANPQLTHYAYDPCSQRSLDNHFQYVAPNGDNIAGQSYQYYATFTVNQGIFVRVIPLYAPTIMAVSVSNGSNPMPAQGTVVQSTGTSGGTQRTVITYHYYPKLPNEILQYGLFMQ